MSNEPYIKRKSRTLSRFLCQEMMYDFVTDNLDEERKQAMLDYIQRSEETQEDLEAFQEALNYCEQLSHLTPTEPLIEKVKSQSSLSKKIINALSWNNWPQPVKWTLQGALVSVLAAGVAIFIPWERLQIDLDLKSKGSPLYVAEQQTQEIKPEENVEPEINQATSEPQELDSSEAKLIAEEPTPVETIEPPLEPENKQEKVKESIVAENNNDSEVESEATKSRSAVVKSNLKGSLTRMYMTVKDFKEFSLVVEDFIRSVGGSKAGQVKLGWEKNQNTRYFHFTIPEKDYPNLMQLLRTKADTRVMRTPHSRVMPEGKMRLILEISSDD
ncbi:MAG: hypothetical protein MK008_07120 [Bdellovibrionales bacterium]|nr:hypothetical protein [Bdellovibrionales bacterium]